ncbi:MAG: hypothetical protein PWQ27_1379 [Kosmotoga sp.]|jgi:oxygen-independent coproporphyrinogen-3 oxidase|nr:hypothetical protein [Kosmotoga sp.]
MKEVGIYIHLPFCKRKCDYCDFLTLPFDADQAETYNKALLSEIELWTSNNELMLKTLYFGGGSPSLYQPRFLEKLIDRLAFSSQFQVEELTLEANPWEITCENLRDWKELGVNRLSIGIQTAPTEVLNNVGRKNPVDLLRRLEFAREAFDNVNFDFILGLPGESRETFENNIKLIERFLPEHISYYILDTDHDTPLMRRVLTGKIELPSVDLITELHEHLIKTLEEKGYNRYEISSWSREGYQCIHNKNYWENGEYVGLGISAGGHFNRFRYVNTTSFSEYVKAMNVGHFAREYEHQNNDLEELFETLFMGLRLVEGVRISRFQVNESLLEKVVERIEKSLEGFVIVDNERIKLNDRGLDLSKVVFERLMGIKEEIEDVFTS